MGNKKSKNRKPRPQLCVCPKCMQYGYGHVCKICGYKKGIQSVMHNEPASIEDIPWEDMVRIVENRRINGFSYDEFSNLLVRAKHLGVRIPNDNKPLYGLKKPKAQTGGFGGIANHAAPSKGNVRSISGGGCSPR